MHIPKTKNPKQPFMEFAEPLSEIRESLHQLGAADNSGDGSYVKLLSRALEAAINGGLRKSDFVFNHMPEKRRRVFMTIFTKEKRTHQRTILEGSVMQLIHEINVICEESECAVLEWFPAQVACWNLVRILTQEFVKGTQGAFFSTTTRLSHLFEAAQNGLEKVDSAMGKEELVFD